MHPDTIGAVFLGLLALGIAVWGIAVELRAYHDEQDR